MNICMFLNVFSTIKQLACSEPVPSKECLIKFGFCDLNWHSFGCNCGKFQVNSFKFHARVARNCTGQPFVKRMYDDDD